MARTLVTSRVRAGRWEGLLAAPGDAAAPEIEVIHLDQSLPGVAVAKGEDGWRISVPIPSEVLNDGVQVFVVRDRTSQEKLGAFTLLTGVPLEDDIRAELELLRAELDILKKAFRQHCLTTGG